MPAPASCPNPDYETAMCVDQSQSGYEQQRAACDNTHNARCDIACVAAPQQPATSNMTLDEGYCFSATDMYMQGFVWPGTQRARVCVLLLFADWVLDSEAKFAC